MDIALICRFSPGCIGVLLFQGDVGEGDTDNSGCRHLCCRELKLKTLDGNINSVMSFVTLIMPFPGLITATSVKQAFSGKPTPHLNAL